MPEIRFTITWPDGRQERCYSPSLIVQNFFTPNTSYPIAEFLQRSRTSLTIASERVKQKFGYPCSRALGQLAGIENTAATFSAMPGAQVKFEDFDE